jgi:Transglutaminase-like superfamily
MSSVPEHLKFRLALWLWALWLPLLAYRRDLKSLIVSAAPPPELRYQGLTPEYIAKRVQRAVRKPWLMRDRPCLRAGLLAYRFLALAGHRPELHFGIDQASIAARRLGAHCWVVLNGRILLNQPTGDMVEVLVVRAGSDGRPELTASRAESLDATRLDATLV